MEFSQKLASLHKMVNQTIVVYSEGDTRSVELIKEKMPNVILKKIEPTVDPEAEPLDTYLNHNILLGLELANPYVKKYFPNIVVHYDTETISGYPEISLDSKYIIKTITTLSYLITVVGGFAEIDTWRATHQFLGIVYIPPIAKYQGYFKGTVLAGKGIDTNALSKSIHDTLQEASTPHGITIGDVVLTDIGAYGKGEMYEFKCDVYEGESPIGLLVIVAIIGAILVGIYLVSQIFYQYMLIAYYEAEKEMYKAIQAKENLVGSLTETLAKLEACTTEYHDLKDIIDKLQAEEVTTPVTPPTDWMTMLTNMMPLILMLVVLGMVTRVMPKGED